MDISLELAKLHQLTGADFIRQLKLIVSGGGFHPVEGEIDIFSVGGEHGDDYDNLLNAARKAVNHGYRVYIYCQIPSGLELLTTYLSAREFIRCLT